jgi:predicted alpha/beta-hydrolase family hydrolase
LLVVPARSLLLFPGAGGGCDHHTLLAIEAGLEPRSVARRDFPYRKEGRRAPDRAPKLIAAIRDEVDALVASGSTAPDELVLGGRSMGGRMCSMAVAEGLPAAGLLLLSYPLHPPGKPDRLRTDHFGAIDVPCLFISGTRDPFGTPDELEAHVETIVGPVTIVWLEGQRHDPKGCDDTIVDAIRDWFATI